jgi:multiple sugar transport system permease protein
MAQAAAVAKPPAPPRRRRASATPRRLPYLLIAPAALLMLGFIAYPVLSVFYHSLQNYNPTKPWRNGFAGLANFTQAFAHDPQFWDSLTFSATWVVVEVGLQLLFGLALALIVNQRFVGRALGRALVFSPWAVSGVLTSAIWVLLYNSQTDLTRYLADAGIGSYGTSWLSDTSTVFPAAVVADLWRSVPFFAILILADLQSVSTDLYEVDGAGRLEQFCRPALHPHRRRLVLGGGRAVAGSRRVCLGLLLRHQLGQARQEPGGRQHQPRCHSAYAAISMSEPAKAISAPRNRR